MPPGRLPRLVLRLVLEVMLLMWLETKPLTIALIAGESLFEHGLLLLLGVLWS